MRRAVLSRPTRLDELADHACLVHTPTEPGNWFFKRGKQVIGQPVNATIVADSYLPLLEFARHGLGIIRVSRGAIQADLRRGSSCPSCRSSSVSIRRRLPGIWIL